MKCPACGEAVLDAKESRRVNILMREFNQQVNSAIVDPAFIMTVCKKSTWTNAKPRRYLAAG